MSGCVPAVTREMATSGARSDMYDCLMQLWLTDVEIFATVIAALVHDYEHNGTTNAFHVNTECEYQLCTS